MKIKNVLAVLGGLALTAGSANMIAKADEVYKCDCDTGIWMRATPDTSTDDNKICVIPTGCTISVDSADVNWGHATYIDNIGNEYVGWTCLDLYSKLDIQSVSSDNTVRDKVYNYLVNTLGFNRASAIGILTNMEYESKLRPNIEVMDTNGLYSIGICQWNGSRNDAFKSFCNERVYEYGSLDAQLEYLQYELEHDYIDIYNKMLKFSNDADGAYNAAYYWASKFEVCNSVYWEERAQSAYSNY